MMNEMKWVCCGGGVGREKEDQAAGAPSEGVEVEGREGKEGGRDRGW